MLALPPAEDAGTVAAVLRQIDEGEAGSGAALLHGIVQSGYAPRRETIEILLAYDRVPMLRQTVGRISSSVGAVRWRLFATSKRGDAKALGQAISQTKAESALDLGKRSAMIKAGLETGDLREVLRHPYLDLLRDPNGEHTGLAVRTLTQTYLDLVGESFWWLPTDGATIPNALWPIVPHWVKSTPTPSFEFYEVSHRSFNATIPASEMAWFRELDPIDPYSRGCGIAKTLADELDGDEWAAKHIAAFFKNGAMPDGIGLFPDADDDQIKMLTTDWANANRGSNKSHRMHFMNAEGRIHELGASFKDSDVVELRKFYNDKVRATYNVPPEVVGQTEDSNRATSTAALRHLAVLVIMPRLEFLRVEQQSRVLPMYPDGDRLLLIYDDPIPEDQEFNLKAAEANPGSLTSDEWRDIQGRNPIADGSGSVHLVPNNVVAVESLADVGKPAAQQETRSAAVHVVQKGPPSAADVEGMIELLEPIPILAHSDPVMARLVADFGGAMVREVGSDLAFNVLNPLVVEHLASQSVTRIVGLVHEGTKQALRDELLEGVAHGEGAKKLAKRVRTVFSVADETRSMRIARTEALRSANFGRQQAMSQTGLVANKQWLTANDTRVRFEPRENADHRILNRQTVQLERPFVVPSGRHIGRTAMHPLDFGVKSLDIQCRCVSIPIVAEVRGGMSSAFSKDATDVELKAVLDEFESRADRWIDILRTALRLGFSEQQTRMLQFIRALEPRS